MLLCGKKSQNVLHQIRCTDLKFYDYPQFVPFALLSYI